MNKHNNPPIYALDFDGVICDSAIETAITGWKAAQKIWQDMPDGHPPQILIDHFRSIRPFLETGYEAILIMRLLQQGMGVKALTQGYHCALNALIKDNQLKIAPLKQLFGVTRDQWITQSPQEWLTMNPLFSGVLAKLEVLENNPSNPWYIITTKQKRFVQQILQHYKLHLNDQFIYAMEDKLTKQAVLLQLREKHADQTLVFIEDRLPTLINISENKPLNNIKLQLVDWGYNTDEDKRSTRQHSIALITQEDFIAIETE